MQGLETAKNVLFAFARVSAHSGLALVVSLIVFVLINELISYAKLGYYKRQGIKTYYSPVQGLIKLARPVFFKKSLEESPISESEDLIAGNHFLSTEPHLLITSPKLLSEFFLQETSNFTRFSMISSSDDIKSFIMDYTDSGMKMRGLFVDFFRMENINKILPDIDAIFAEKLDELIDENWGGEGSRSTTEWKTLDLKPTIIKAFDEMVNVVFFGETDRDAIPKIDGKIYSVYVQEFFHKGIFSMRKPLNILTKHFFFLNKLNSDGREFENMRLRMQKEMGKFYRKRLVASQEKGLGNNLMDILIKRDQEMINKGKPDGVFSAKIMANTTRAFYIAGYDTSKGNSSIGLSWLSRNQELQSKLRDAFKSLATSTETDFFDFNSSDFVNNFVMENLRRFGPVQKTLPRRCLKTCKLGKYTIKKGTTVELDLGRIHTKTDPFKEPFEFNPGRFENLSMRDMRRKSQFLPFSAGRRSCIGQYLGECVIKIVLKTVLERFELRVPEDRIGKDLSLRLGFTLDVVDLKLKLRLIK